MSRYLDVMKCNLRSLAQFSGRTSLGGFWPFAGTVFGVAIAGFAASFLPVFFSTMDRMEKFAREHPELARIEEGPGHKSITIQGNHPELMPDMSAMFNMLLPILVFVVIFLAASVARRLHDRGLRGYWGLLPVPFFAYSAVMMPRMFSDFVKSDPANGIEPDMGMFMLIFLSNMLYMVGLVILIVLLARKGDAAENKFGPLPA